MLDEDGFVENTRENGLHYLTRIMEEIYGEIHQNRHILFRFLKMSQGNWVVVPGPGVFSVYEIVEDKPKEITSLSKGILDNLSLKAMNNKLVSADEKERQIDLGYIWKVKPIEENIPRKEYADAHLTRKLRYPRTNLEITGIKDSITKSIEAFGKRKPINIHELILEKTKEEVHNLILEELDHDKWEKLIKWYFERAGATNVEIPARQAIGKEEGDTDIIATFEPIKTVIYVQAKFHQGNTPKEGVDQIKDYVNLKEDKDEEYHSLAWLVSTAEDFTEEAINLANDNGVLLIDGDEFVKMMLEVGLSNLQGKL